MGRGLAQVGALIILVFQERQREVCAICVGTEEAVGK